MAFLKNLKRSEFSGSLMPVGFHANGNNPVWIYQNKERDKVVELISIVLKLVCDATVVDRYPVWYVYDDATTTGKLTGGTSTQKRSASATGWFIANRFTVNSCGLGTWEAFPLPCEVLRFNEGLYFSITGGVAGDGYDIYALLRIVKVQTNV